MSDDTVLIMFTTLLFVAFCIGFFIGSMYGEWKEFRVWCPKPKVDYLGKK